MSAPSGPLQGLRVIELGQLLAGPFAASMLAYFGAEVIKIEPPGRGDPLRNWRALDECGTSYWWYSLARNKKSVTLNLREDAGRELAHELIMQADIVVENFRPGTLEKWGLGPERYRKCHPDLVYTRISGYGQTGPYADRPGFASACEAMGGLRYLNGHPGQAPVRANLSIGDTLAGMHAVIGTLLALWQQQKPDGKGQVVDASILESVYNLLEGVVPEYSGAGAVREPSGTTVTGIVPTNTYACADGQYVVIGGNGDSIFQRLMHCAERPDLAEDPRMADNAGRVQHEAEIDRALAAWLETLKADEALARLRRAEVPSAPIYSVKDMHEDPHFRARGLFESVTLDSGEVLEVPALLPKLSDTPGHTQHAGPALGAHTRWALCELLGKEVESYEALAQAGIV